MTSVIAHPIPDYSYSTTTIGTRTVTYGTVRLSLARVRVVRAKDTVRPLNKFFTNRRIFSVPSCSRTFQLLLSLLMEHGTGAAFSTHGGNWCLGQGGGTGVVVGVVKVNIIHSQERIGTREQGSRASLHIPCVTRYRTFLETILAYKADASAIE